MKKNYPIHWSATAKKDLKNIVEFIAIENPTRAFEVLQKIREMAASLSTFPERGRIMPEFQDQGFLLYRELIIPPWRLIYKILENKVHVLSVLDSRQNVEDLLLKRFIRLY